MKKTIPIAIIIVGVLVAGAIYLKRSSECPGISGGKQALTAQEVGEKVINFINNDILMGRTTASLTEALEENGLYKLKFTVEGQEIESYATHDGKLFFPEIPDDALKASPG